jgi:hypothetical protein
LNGVPIVEDPERCDESRFLEATVEAGEKLEMEYHVEMPKTVLRYCAYYLRSYSWQLHVVAVEHSYILLLKSNYVVKLCQYALSMSIDQ